MEKYDKRYTFYQDDNVHARVHEKDGFAFIHLDVEEWNRQALRTVKKGMEDLQEHLKEEGYEWLFATSEDEMSVKFWNLIKPTHTVKKFGPRDQYWIGAWKFEE